MARKSRKRQTVTLPHLHSETAGYIRLSVTGKGGDDSIENQKKRVHFPEIYEEIYQLEQSYKRDVSIKTLLNTDKAMNRQLFEDILDKFHSKLEQDFSSRFTEASIGELKQDLVASWLADCSLEFKG